MRVRVLQVGVHVPPLTTGLWEERDNCLPHGAVAWELVGFSPCSMSSTVFIHKAKISQQNGSIQRKIKEGRQESGKSSGKGKEHCNKKELGWEVQKP